MRDNFVKLMDFIFGKYIYTVMKNNDKVLYFEVVDNKYVQPISSFNLYDNAGKSLTSVNEHFFMNQLVSRINVACKKGIFISDQEIIDFLNKIKASCGDPELMKLFKGSYMNEINEFNFEDNKRNIVRYLDKFKFDTFVDYNNVSVFSGSLEKNPSVSSVQSTTDIPQVETDGSQENKGIIQNNVIQDISSGNSNDMEVLDIVEEPIVEASNESGNQQADSSGFDFMNIPVDNSVGDVVSSSDYFSNNQTFSSNAEQVNNQNIQPVVQENGSSSDLTAPLNIDSLSLDAVNAPIQESIVQSNTQSVQEVQPVLQEVVQESTQDSIQQPVSINQSDMIVQENPALQPITSSVDLTAPLDFNSLYSNDSSQPVVENNVVSDNIQMVPNSDFSSSTLNTISNEANGISNDGQHVEPIDLNESPNAQFSNDGFSLAEPLVENAIDSNLNNNNIMYSEQVSAPSYMTEVKDRLQNNSFNNELGVMSPNVTESDLDKTVVVDKLSMPPLESVADEGSKKPKKKKSFGVVIFIIILLLVLAGFAYFLYNYIF